MWWCLTCGYAPAAWDLEDIDLRHWQQDGCHEPTWSAFNASQDWERHKVITTTREYHAHVHEEQPGLSRVPYQLPDGSWIGNNSPIEFKI